MNILKKIFVKKRDLNCKNDSNDGSNKKNNVNDKILCSIYKTSIDDENKMVKMDYLESMVKEIEANKILNRDNIESMVKEIMDEIKKFKKIRDDNDTLNIKYIEFINYKIDDDILRYKEQYIIEYDRKENLKYIKGKLDQSLFMYHPTYEEIKTYKFDKKMNHMRESNKNSFVEYHVLLYI